MDSVAFVHLNTTIITPKFLGAEEPELKPVIAGSAVDLLVQNLKAAKDFAVPTQFAKPAIPADAPRYKVTLEGEWGEFVIALMVQDAPKTCAIRSSRAP